MWMVVIYVYVHRVYRYYRADNLASMSTFMPSAERALFTFVNCLLASLK